MKHAFVSLGNLATYIASNHEGVSPLPQQITLFFQGVKTTCSVEFNQWKSWDLTRWFNRLVAVSDLRHKEQISATSPGSLLDRSWISWILVIQPGENQALPTTSAREKIQQVFNIHQHTMARCWNYHTFCQQEWTWSFQWCYGLWLNIKIDNEHELSTLAFSCNFEA